MAGVITAYSRISHHTLTTAGLTFSVPMQEDFTISGTMAWTPQDLCLSEIGVNEADNKAYIRIGSYIHEIQLYPGTGPGSTPNLTSVLTSGNTTGGKNIQISTGDVIFSSSAEINFDSGLYFSASSITEKLDASNNYELKQSSTFSTTNSTPTTIALCEQLSNTKVGLEVEATIYGRYGFTSSYGSKLYAVFKWDGTQVVQVSTTDVVEKSEFATVTSTIDTDGTNINIKVIGEASTNIDWSCFYTQNVISL